MGISARLLDSHGALFCCEKKNVRRVFSLSLHRVVWFHNRVPPGPLPGTILLYDVIHTRHGLYIQSAAAAAAAAALCRCCFCSS